MILTILFLHIFPEITYSQYFGRNKPGYKTFKYDALHTPQFRNIPLFKERHIHCKIYCRAEEWYSIHQQIFKDTFPEKNPLILYTNHSDFQQTTAISGMIGTTTGGVTEALKNRVVMPVAPTLAQTDHVLGHNWFMHFSLISCFDPIQYAVHHSIIFRCG